MRILFIDTGFLLALEISDDQHHLAATQCWRTLSKTSTRFVTTSFVFAETVTSFNSKRYHHKAVEVGNRLLNSSSVQLIQVEQELFREAWLFFQKHSDKTYSLTDCVSFMVMKRLKIQTALTFDHHFVQAKYLKLP
jgi:uncharacterized protein